MDDLNDRWELSCGLITDLTMTTPSNQEMDSFTRTMANCWNLIYTEMVARGLEEFNHE